MDPIMLFMVVELIDKNDWKISEHWREIPFSTSRLDINQTSNQPTDKRIQALNIKIKHDWNVGINKVFLWDEIDEQKWENEFK